MGGLTAEGSGVSATLWLVNEFGFRLYNVSQTGGELSSPNIEAFIPQAKGIAFGQDFLFVIDDVASQLSQLDKNGIRISVFDLQIEGGGGPVPGVRGLTFKGDVLFMGSANGTVFRSFLSAGVTNDPRGITFTSSTSAVGEALWILVDGNLSDKLLKVDPSDGSLISTFGTNGFVDAPSKETQGITFLAGALWIIANEGGAFDTQPKLFKVNATTGALEQTFNLQTTAQVFEVLGGITNDGTNLLVHSARFFNTVFVIDTNGLSAGQEQAFPCCPPFEGARGFAFNTGKKQFFVARGRTIAKYNENLEFVSQDTLKEQDGVTELAAATDIRGATFDGDVFYVADRGAAKYARASWPAPPPRSRVASPSRRRLRPPARRSGYW